MTKLNLDISGIEPPPLPETAVIDVKHQPYLDILSRALASPRGIKLTFDSENTAYNQRFRLYSARRHVERQGIRSFSKITIKLRGPSLIITPDLPPEIEEL